MDDTISRQAAIKWVKTECNPYGKPTLDFESGKKVIEHLERMPSAEPPWIPCSERLPEEKLFSLQELSEAADRAYKYGKQDAQPNSSKYEYHYDHTDCIWYRPESRNRCPVTCAQYRDGWNDAMNYIFRDGKGYRPYRRDEQYEE